MARLFAKAGWRPIRFRLTTSGRRRTRCYIVFNFVLFSWSVRIF